MAEFKISQPDTEEQIDRAIKNINIIISSAEKLYRETEDDVYDEIADYCVTEKKQLKKARDEPKSSKPSVCERAKKSIIYLEEIYPRKYTDKINKISEDKFVNVYQKDKTQNK